MLNQNVKEPRVAVDPIYLLGLLLWLVLFAKLISSLYASIDARGLYADGANYLVGLYERAWFLTGDKRTTVQILRQAPIVLLSRYTSATLFECGQVFTFAMLTLPTALCAMCWVIVPRDRRAWMVFPLLALLTGYAATSFQAIGEAAIATSYYWILLFLLMFRARSTVWQALFLLLCIPAFRLHEGAFPLTIILLAALAVHTYASRSRLFVGATALMLTAILAYQLRWVIYPQFREDRDDFVGALSHFRFLYAGGYVNLQFIVAALAFMALATIFFAYAARPPVKAERVARTVTVVWTILAVAAMVAAVTVEQSFSPYTHLQARYHPVMISAALGALMILLFRYEPLEKFCTQPAILFILISLCLTQTVGDMAATARWSAYVADLRSRLANGRGLIPWEATLHTANPGADLNWRLMSIGFSVPFESIIYAPNGVVSAIIDTPTGTLYRPLSLKDPDRLPHLRGVDYTPYKGFLSSQKFND